MKKMKKKKKKEEEEEEEVDDDDDDGNVHVTWEALTIFTTEATAFHTSLIKIISCILAIFHCDICWCNG